MRVRSNGPFDVGKELTHRTRHLPSAKMMLSPVYINIQDNNLIHHVLSGRLIATQIGNGNDIIQQRGGRAMIIQDPRIKAKRPQCGS